jgi:pyridoxamine 5'-phosphate oxidase
MSRIVPYGLDVGDGTEDGDALGSVAAARADYTRGGLTEDDLLPDPVAMFRRWYDDAHVAGLHEPNAMVVATVSAEGRPSVRTVLLKGVDERGFVFYTNYASRKGRDLEDNPAVALLFPWHDLQRQVRVEGTASQVSQQESEAYFASRPRGSQLGAWASPQSSEVDSRAELDQRYAAAEDRFAEGDVPLPPAWGGYRVAPETMEFWQGRRGRMHDRLVYSRVAEGWRTSRLAP